jgi:hypothetical protein
MYPRSNQKKVKDKRPDPLASFQLQHWGRNMAHLSQFFVGINAELDSLVGSCVIAEKSKTRGPQGLLSVCATPAIRERGH